MSDSSQSGASAAHDVSLAKRLVTAVLYGFGMFIGLTVVIWILRETFYYPDVLFDSFYGPAWFSRNQALGSNLPALAIIPWALEYFVRIPMHVITGLLIAWKSIIVVVWAVLGFFAAGYQPPRQA